MSWGKKLAKIWLNYVPPSRPSYSEMCIYTMHLRKIQKKLKKKAELLILGSTAEFRDWGYEQFLNVTVLDFSYDYYLESSIGMRHRNLKEVLVEKKWQDMDFENKFDVIIGDLVIGNLKPKDVEDFLRKVSRALTKNGVFMTKSLFRKRGASKNLEEILIEYYTGYTHYHPFTKMMYDLNFSCMNNSELLDFQTMWKKVTDAFRAGILKKDTYDFFSKLGWQHNMKFQFYIPAIDLWESMLKKIFAGYDKRYGEDIYSYDIPVYIIYKNL